jgi:hypothetical protein
MEVQLQGCVLALRGTRHSGNLLCTIEYVEEISKCDTGAGGAVR